MTCISEVQVTVAGSPREVLKVLTDPEAIAEWAPVSFELLELVGDRLTSGSTARVAGAIAGRSVAFDVDVTEASEERLRLKANGPIVLDVEYALTRVAAGTEIAASVSVDGQGLSGAVLASASCVLLTSGVLAAAIDRVAGELARAQRAGRAGRA